MDAAPDSVVRKRRRESLISPALPGASQPPRVGECPATQVLRHGPSTGSAWITEAIEVPCRSARASREVQTRREGGRGLLVINRGHCQALRVQPADIMRGVATRQWQGKSSVAARLRAGVARLVQPGLAQLAAADTASGSRLSPTLSVHELIQRNAACPPPALEFRFVKELLGIPEA